MIKIQKKDFNIDEEIKLLKDKYSNVGAVNIFIGYVRDYNDNKDVKYLNLEVYQEMAFKELSKIENNATKKWNLIDTLIIHRYGKLIVNEKIVLVCCFSHHRKNSFQACDFIMDYLKKDAPFWKNEFYYKDDEWLENSS